MSGRSFSKPVSTIVGLGFARDVDTSQEAYRVLTEWQGATGPTHAMAVKVCRMAIAGETSVEAARFAFEAFARTRGMLAPDALIEPTQLASELLPPVRSPLEPTLSKPHAWPIHRAARSTERHGTTSALIEMAGSLPVPDVPNRE